MVNNRLKRLETKKERREREEVVEVETEGRLPVERETDQKRGTTLGDEKTDKWLELRSLLQMSERENHISKHFTPSLHIIIASFRDRKM